MLEMKYKGRRYSSASAMMRDMQRDMVKQAEQEMAKQARLSGLFIRRTSKGLKATGTEAQMKRFQKRMGQ